MEATELTPLVPQFVKVDIDKFHFEIQIDDIIKRYKIMAIKYPHIRNEYLSVYSGKKAFTMMPHFEYIAAHNTRTLRFCSIFKRDSLSMFKAEINDQKMEELLTFLNFCLDEAEKINYRRDLFLSSVVISCILAILYTLFNVYRGYQSSR